MKWIKCSDQMPPHNKCVLILNDKGIIASAKYTYDDTEWDFIGCGCLYYQYEKIISWAEYPELTHE